MSVDRAFDVRTAWSLFLDRLPEGAVHLPIIEAQPYSNVTDSMWRGEEPWPAPSEQKFGAMIRVKTNADPLGIFLSRDDAAFEWMSLALVHFIHPPETAWRVCAVSDEVVAVQLARAPHACTGVWLLHQVDGEWRVIPKSDATDYLTSRIRAAGLGSDPWRCLET